MVKGLVKVRDGKTQLNCQQAQRYQHVKQESKAATGQNQCHLIINLNQTENAEEDVDLLHRVIGVLQNYPGQDKVSFAVTTEDETTDLEMPEITVDYCPELASELSNILGEGNLRLES